MGGSLWLGTRPGLKAGGNPARRAKRKGHDLVSNQFVRRWSWVRPCLLGSAGATCGAPTGDGGAG
jgi:hypothetical protein